jgi:hypothetical protein
MSNNERKAAWLLALFCGLPFVCGAAVKFLPMWLSVPSVFVLGMFWIGTAIQIRDS